MWPQFSTITKEIEDKIKSVDGHTASKKMCWIRVISGANKGLVMWSNTDFSLFSALGEQSLYGDLTKSGVVGVDLNGNVIGYENDFNVLKPSPVITGLTVKEGKDQISKQAELTIKAFTLGQLEIIQEYLMEPGFSLLIEFGWNTVSGLKLLIPRGDKQFVSKVTEYNLNQDSLHGRRVSSKGDYDSFFGFIVGGDVSTGDDETFNIKIKLRGAPGLPTYLQGHTNIKKQDENGKIQNTQSLPPFNVVDIEGPDVDWNSRRLKYLFNSLPTTRQTKDVLDNVISKTIYNHNDFINFDKVTENIITTKVDKEGIEYKGSLAIPKEKLYSSQKYIRFRLAVDILNANTALNSIVIGNKKIQVGIDIDDCIIGGFPLIYSTKKEKLIIPGELPDFSKYFLSEAGQIDLTKEPPIDNRINILGNTNPDGSSVEKPAETTTAAPSSGLGFLSFAALQTAGGSGEIIEFLGQKDLEPFKQKDKNGQDKVIRGAEDKSVITRGYKEKAKYYGFIKNLYINFDLFYKELDSKNKTMRQVLESLLNEMSSAVNSFWKFQIIESTHDEYKDGKLVDSYIRYKIIDENWVGENTSEPATFYHNGENSKFLEANLSMNIPGQMTSQIVLKRLSLASNPDAPEVKLGGLFSKSKDMFMVGIIDRNNSVNKKLEDKTWDELTPEEKEAETARQARLSGERKITLSNGDVFTLTYNIKRPGIKDTTRYTKTQEWASESIKKEAEAIEQKEMANMDQQANLQKERMERDLLVKRLNNDDTLTTAEKDKIQADIKAKDKLIKEQYASIAEESKLIAEEMAKVEEKNEQQKASNVTSNLDKIDVVVNPQADPSEEDIKNITDPTTFRDTFRIYCCDDTDLFDTLRKNAFNGQGDGATGRYSHPLPIKYNFTVKGVSGIRRGDTFNIIGIPSKYAEHGLFQITEVDHTVVNSSWTTEVTGEYRQMQ